jgi:hypothetical protein
VAVAGVQSAAASTTHTARTVHKTRDDLAISIDFLNAELTIDAEKGWLVKAFCVRRTLPRDEMHGVGQSSP